MPDFKQQFILYTDACDEGLGAMLSQKDSMNKCRPGAFYSKKLTAQERKYATGEKELMAIVFAMVHYKVYLYGREFIVRTDHRPLQWLKNLACPSTRLARWLLIVRQFEFKIEFVSGISNAAADALSRFFIYGPDKEEIGEPGIVLNQVRVIEQIETEQCGDQDLITLKKWIATRSMPDKVDEGMSSELKFYFRNFDKFKSIGGNVYREIRNKSGESIFQYVVPKEKRQGVMELLHDSIWSGHLARDKTLDKFQARFFGQEAILR
jgi:hypothetical protein